MARKSSSSRNTKLSASRNHSLDGKPDQGTWFEPGWRATTTGGAILLSLCLIANICVLIWACARPAPQGAPKADDNPVLVDGDCNQVNTIKQWSHLAINVVSTLILSTSTVCMQCLSAPTRGEIDEAHRRGRWLDVGILSTRNLPYIDRKRIFLYAVLGLSSIPLHLFYNSVIFTTLGTYDTFTILTTNDFTTSTITNSSHISYLYTKLAATQRDYSDTSYPYNLPDNFDGVYEGSDPWQSAIRAPNGLPELSTIRQAVYTLSPSNASILFENTTLQPASPQDCLGNFSNSPLTGYHNVALVTSISSNVNGTLLDMDFTLAPGRSHWTCNQADWMYNNTDLFFGTCMLHPAAYLNYDRNRIAANITDPLPSGYWTVDSCYYQEVPQRCTVVFAKWLMLVVVIANIFKLAAMIYTIRFLNFQPCITVGDMVASFLRKPDIHTVGITPHSNLSIKESYRYEISRIFSLEHPGLKSLIGPKAQQHESLMHQRSWTSKPQRWRSAASTRRWSVTIGLWLGAVFVLAAFVSIQAAQNFNSAWSQGLGDAAPDFIIPTASPTGQALLAQTVLSNIPQIFLSGIYVFYSGLLTTMLSARELAGFATHAKTVRVSPPKAGAQRSTYFLQVPYKFAIPVISVVALLHWLISQAIFLVRLDEYDVLGRLKVASFESVLGYSLRGSLGTLIVAVGMTFFPIILGFIKLPAGIPLVGHNSIAISIACHPLADEPEDADHKPLRYGLVKGVDEKGEKRTRIGFSAGEVEPLEGGEVIEDERCLSTLLFQEHGLEHTCTMERNSWHVFVKVMKGDVKMS